MTRRFKVIHTASWALAWSLLVLAGGAWLVRSDIAQRREAFAADARAAHRLLSQRAAQLDATLAALALLPASARDPEQRLIAFYPELVAVQRRSGDAVWDEATLAAADARSRAAGNAAIATLDRRALTVVRAGTPDSVALRIDSARLVPWSAWPSSLMPGGPVRVTLAHESVGVQLQPGAADPPAGLTAGFVFAKALDLPGWPLTLQLQRATGPAQWPWAGLAGIALATALALAATAWWRKSRRERRRAEELLRVGRVARLNALGELAGGIAHELNQPLAAVLANAQAARRMLDDVDEPGAREQAREAMQQAALQARRAADVVARLRRRIESPDAGLALRSVDLAASCAQVLELLEPALRAQAIGARVEGQAPLVRADPVALEQIVHNLVGNAMQALQGLPSGQPRQIVLAIAAQGARAALEVRDNGPGIADDLWPHLFEPFVTSRAQGEGLGLGLSLCRSLAQSMAGSLDAEPLVPRGVQFRLELPLAD